ncbi:leucine-rich repeat domain-containing protein [Candidatus Babeliales bacterium]|nr:leucine-rich repeat domain-containing protein [Candidatus Babeliales bacterium]
MNILKNIFIILLFATCFDFGVTKVFAQELDKNEQEVAQENQVATTENSTEKTVSVFKISELNKNEKIPYKTLKICARLCITALDKSINAPEKNELLEKLDISDEFLDFKFKLDQIHSSDYTKLDLGFLNLGEYTTSIEVENKFLFFIAMAEIMKIETLYLDNNDLTDLPAEIGKLENLKFLYLSNNKLTKLPKEIGNLKKLVSLDLADDLLVDLPEEINQLTNLECLYLRGNKLKALPASFDKLKKIKNFNIDFCDNNCCISFEFYKNF